MSVHPESASPNVISPTASVPHDMLDGATRLELEKYLLPGEKILWCNRPHFSWCKALRHFAPLILYFGVVLVFIFPLLAFVATVNNTAPVQEVKNTDTSSVQAPVELTSVLRDPVDTGTQTKQLVGVLMLSTIGAAFMTIWSYMIFQGINGRALLHPFTVHSTWYGVTNMRVMVLNTRAVTQLTSYHLLRSESLRYEQDADDTGSIYAGKAINSIFWMEPPPLYLQSIDQPGRVFQLMVEVQAKLLSGTSVAGV